MGLLEGPTFDPSRPFARPSFLDNRHISRCWKEFDSRGEEHLLVLLTPEQVPLSNTQNYSRIHLVLRKIRRDTAGDAYRVSQKNSAEISIIKDSMTKSEEKIYKRIDTLDEQMNMLTQPEYQEFVLEGAEFDRYRDLWWKKVEQYYLLNM